MRRYLASNHLLFLVLAAVVSSGGFMAADQHASWPQWGGPDRDFHLDGRELAESWPNQGPKELWSRELGEGYSTVVAGGGVLYTMYRRPSDDVEVVVALDAGSGETLWEHSYPAPLIEDMNAGTWLRQAGPGPYSTPLIDGDQVVTVGVTGKFFAFDRRSGEIRWFRNLHDEFEMSNYRGYASSPIAYRQTILLPVGGRGRAVVAFDRRNGEVVWKRHDFGLAPASPILIRLDGQDQLVVFTPQELVGLDPSNGDLLWRHSHQTSYGLNISTPVWGEGNLLFCSSAYNGGSRVIRLRRDGDRTTTEELWFNNRMRLHFGNAIRMGDHVYGTSGDFGPAFFVALDIRTGEEVWRERGFSRAQMLRVGDRLIIVDEDGSLALATPGPDGLDVHARVEALTENAWTPPTLVGTTLFLRDRQSIRALDLGK